MYPVAMMLAMSTNDWIPIVFVAGLTVIAWAVARKRVGGRRGGSAGPSMERPAGGGLSPSEYATMARQMNETLVELQETARRISAQIDNRGQKLEMLLAEADEKITRLEKLKAEMEGLKAWPGEPGRTNNMPPPPSMAAAYEDPQHRAVYALADRGKSSREIAAETGKQPGEVELILALRGGR